jgi:hypothetical protein
MSQAAHLGSSPTQTPPRDHFERRRANDVVVQEGYSAPYLYLLEEDAQECAAGSGLLRAASRYTLRKLRQIERALREGAGQGRGDAYQPWIRIRRGFSSPVSHQVFESVGVNRRNHHFLSLLEFRTALVTAYLGSTELRECLPMWPYEHPHPNFDDEAPQRVAPDPVPGLLEIAAAAGIDHGTFIGTKIPYVGTIDLVHRLPSCNGFQYVGISCKPRDIIDRSERARQRLELDRLYCQVIGAWHVIEDGRGLHPEVLKNLQWLCPLTSEIRAHRGTSQLLEFSRYFDECADAMPLRDAAMAAGAKCGLREREDAFLFLRLGIWTHLVDIDLSQPIRMTRPMRRGAERVLAPLRERYLGEGHD